MSNLLRDGFRRRLILLLLLLIPTIGFAASVATRRKQEPMRQKFVVESADGKVIANAEEVTVAEGDHMKSDLAFRFLDGSLDEQITTFTQSGVFRLINDHHVQKGSSFPAPLDMTIDVPTGTVTWHVPKGGKDTVMTQHLKLPEDLANGLVPLLVENVPPGSAGLRVSWIAIAMMKPILITLAVQPDHSSNTAPALSHASRYFLHAELHGLTYYLASLFNKQPADLHVWVTDGVQPSFLRLQGPFYQNGPVWTVESLGPEMPTATL